MLFPCTSRTYPATPFVHLQIGQHLGAGVPGPADLTGPVLVGGFSGLGGAVELVAGDVGFDAAGCDFIKLIIHLFYLRTRI